MVKIRLMRIGAKKRPFYRVVAIDERKQRGGKYLELLGTYNPLTEPHEIILKNDRIDWWIKNGAILSDGYLRITKQAPQRPPRKPKKAKQVTEGSEQTKAEEAKPEEKPEETQVEEAADNTSDGGSMIRQSAEKADSSDVSTEGQDPQSETEEPETSEPTTEKS